MSRRSLPTIDPNDLRDHASDDRVERIWARLETDLDAQGLVSAEGGSSSVVTGRRATPSGVASASARRRTWALLAAAALFGGGVWAGRALFRQPAERPAEVGSTKEAAVELFAAGTQARSFTLANGGTLLLEPESMVEVAEIADTGMTLRLLRGSASIDNTHGAFGAVAVVAGEARLTAPAGGVMAVRRNERDVDVIVSGGTVDLDAPGVHQQLSSGDRLHAVPISTPTAVLEPPNHRGDMDTPLAPSHALRVARDGHPERSPSEVVPEAASAPSWYSRYRVGDDDGALKLLEQSGDMRSVILNAQSGAELAALSDLNVKRSDLWLLAAKRAVDEFPHDPKVVGLPMSLGNYYSQQGNEELAKKYFALAGALFADDVACRGLRGADPASPDSAEKARAYLAKFPSGSCHAEAEALVEGLEGAKPDGADAAKPEGSSEPKGTEKAPDGKAGDGKAGDGKAGDGRQSEGKQSEPKDPKDAGAKEPAKPGKADKRGDDKPVEPRTP